MSSILEKIVAQRRLDVEAARQVESLEQLYSKLPLAPSPIDFYHRLLQGLLPTSDGITPKVAIIGEVKRASPSKGDIAPDADAAKIATEYARGGAAAISVLTEPTWFKGSLKDLYAARQAIEAVFSSSTPSTPSSSTLRPAFLRKDFIIDEYQLVEARLCGADTVLLIVACLDDKSLLFLLQKSRELGMEPLVEVNNENEMKRALNCGAKVIGVNNRNLHNFNVDMNTTNKLAQEIPKDGDVLLAALSGISNRSDVVGFEKEGVKVILVGESLMRSNDKKAFIRQLIDPSKDF